MTEQREKIELEYMLKTSPAILFNRLSTPSGLSEWFADDVSVKGKEFIFIWGESHQSAEQTLRKENKLVRYTWLDDEMDGSWFEFQINVDELTGDVALVVIDHVEPEEVEDSKELWNQQVDVLKHGLGSA
ncbi:MULTISPECIES: START-like domain-containing protein [Marinilabiliaceae]|uniref:START-like domain-containing protein n=2 Tax=Marinilabiliaceae TaxID=558415 RepID=A0A1T5HHU8_9BACT|nr:MULTISPECIES: START-like domain-containing protein [Marinilabiliaceae]ASB48149.1 hypothetical protein CDL62_02815 [Alkalitalea saponilacus]TCO07025.1 hypothetical protein EV194_11023 [Natronoflexus pectinivorans]SKC20199.1 hypothetical protein SAMN03080601_02328 [Alkalitalea saponilacus]